MSDTRSAKIVRNTNETQIELKLTIDGTGTSSISTGIPFFDHMLELFSRHGIFDLELKATGDIAVDYHHTVEDVGIVLGEAFKKALGDKRGIRRYGFFVLPMDECLARVAVDLSNRPLMVYKVEAEEAFVRDFNIHLFREFFQAFANSAGANVHLGLVYGDEPHHIAEALFKGFAQAMRMACESDPRRGDQLPTTKGMV
jgi:imidazoleglycerol-phosphate dehydratase|tara:strand:- start:105241 stop:105837 length:597 start_codon:yes stop_codon:yes gene_type:complete